MPIITIPIFASLRRILTGQKANRDSVDYAVLAILLISQLRPFYSAKRKKNSKKAYKNLK